MHIRRDVAVRDWHWDGPRWWWKRVREWSNGSDIAGKFLNLFRVDTNTPQNTKFR